MSSMNERTRMDGGRRRWPAGWMDGLGRAGGQRMAETGKRPHPRAYPSLLRSALYRGVTDWRTFDLHRSSQVSTVNAARLCSRTCSYTPASRSETESRARLAMLARIHPLKGSLLLSSKSFTSWLLSQGTFIWSFFSFFSIFSLFFFFSYLHFLIIL